MSARSLRSFSFLLLAFLVVFSLIGCGDGGDGGETPGPPPSGAWSGTQQFGTTGNDIGYGITLDGSADAFITGSTNGNLDGNTSSGLSDIFVVKFNSAGVKQ